MSLQFMLEWLEYKNLEVHFLSTLIRTQGSRTMDKTVQIAVKSFSKN